MAKKSKNLPDRTIAAQLKKLKELQRRCGSSGLLDVDAPDLLLDNYAKDYCRGSKKRLRLDVSKSASSIIYWSGVYLQRFPAARKLAGDFLSIIADIDRRPKSLRSLDETSRNLLYAGLESDTGVSPYLICDDVLGLVQDLHDRSELLKNHRVTEPLPTGNILVQEFVREMSAFHYRRTGKPAPTARASRFVDFMQAVWSDLVFPDIPEGTLGHMAERLPHSGVQKIFETAGITGGNTR